MLLPEALPDFLRWFRERTEEVWADFRTEKLADFQRRGIGGTSWLTGTKWKPGLSDAEIDELERNSGVAFPPDYRLYLKILNAPDRGARSFHFERSGLVQDADQMLFVDWSDEVDVRKKRQRVNDGILADVLSGVWFERWGVRPDGQDAGARHVTSLINEAPPLLPIFNHRFLPSQPVVSGLPVLSIFGTDAVIYGDDLRHYLLNEFWELLALDFAPARAERAINTQEMLFWGILLEPDP